MQSFSILLTMLAEVLAFRLSKSEDNVPVRVLSVPRMPSDACNNESNQESTITLYIGSAGASRNLSALEKLNIDSIISVHQSLSKAFVDRFRYLIVPVRDKPEEDLSKYFQDAINFIDEANNGVLVHCMQGKSRSASIIAAYIIYKGIANDLEEAMQYIRKARPGAEPNLGFATQLRIYARKQSTSRKQKADGSV